MPLKKVFAFEKTYINIIPIVWIELNVLHVFFPDMFCVRTRTHTHTINLKKYFRQNCSFHPPDQEISPVFLYHFMHFMSTTWLQRHSFVNSWLYALQFRQQNKIAFGPLLLKVNTPCQAGTLISLLTLVPAQNNSKHSLNCLEKSLWKK